jgi:hypothetical protein
VCSSKNLKSGDLGPRKKERKKERKKGRKKERGKDGRKEDGFSLDLIMSLNKSVDAFKTITGTLHKDLDSV